MMGLLLRLGRMTAFITLTLILMPIQAVLVLLRVNAAARSLPVFYHRWCGRILGIELDFRGTRTSHRPTLFVANHISYLDITIIGGAIEGSFVAKAEVSRWPLFGWLARLQRTIFVERTDRAGAMRQRDAIRKRLDDGDNLILFPEGTSNDGTHLLPFKSTLFSAADDERVLVQPVSVAYRLLDGMPLGRFYRPFFAWYGDMLMLPHLWTFLGFGRLTVVIMFHEPVRLADFASRKALSEHCWQVINNGLSAALSGRLDAPVPAHAVLALS